MIRDCDSRGRSWASGAAAAAAAGSVHVVQDARSRGRRGSRGELLGLIDDHEGMLLDLIEALLGRPPIQQRTAGQRNRVGGSDLYRHRGGVPVALGIALVVCVHPQGVSHDQHGPAAAADALEHAAHPVGDGLDVAAGELEGVHAVGAGA